MYYFGKHENILRLDDKMIIMNLNVDNLYAFNDFSMNMSYPKKIVKSLIPHEHLENRLNFRYKKVNIIMGGNATGKTSIGKILKDTLNFIVSKDSERFDDSINLQNKSGKISMDFVLGKDTLYRLDINIDPTKFSNQNSKQSSCCVRHVTINKNDSYEKCAEKLEKIPQQLNQNIAQELEKIDSHLLSWYFTFPDYESKVLEEKNDSTYLKFLSNTLKTLDPSIQKIEKINDIDNSYIIRTVSNDIIVQEGRITKPELLSSGTISGLDIAHALYVIHRGHNYFYYCDEKFSYIHSDVEKTILCFMISCLKNDNQLFFTTHNADILDIDLPKHSFVFLRKELINSEYVIKCVEASHFLKRNTDSLRNAVENDLFSVSPSLDLLYELEDIS